MALAGPPRNHENGAAAKAIFTPGKFCDFAFPAFCEFRLDGVLGRSSALSHGGFLVDLSASIISTPGSPTVCRPKPRWPKPVILLVSPRSSKRKVQSLRAKRTSRKRT